MRHGLEVAGRAKLGDLVRELPEELGDFVEPVPVGASDLDEALLAPGPVVVVGAMFWTAANTEGHDVGHVVRWVLELDRPQGDSGGTLAPLVRLLTDHADPAIALAARQVQGWLHGQWSTDPRTTSSVYATARNAVWPWADPAVAATADGCDITLEWLLADANTLYLSAPLGDETRVGIVFAVLLHDLVTQAFDRYNRTGEALDPRLLVLLDEAANTPLPKLPQWASTVTGADGQRDGGCLPGRRT